MSPLRLPIAGAVCCALSAPCVYAEPDADAEPGPLVRDILVVSASREPVADEHVTGSLDLLDADTLETSKQPIVSELLRTTPGISLGRSGGVGQQTQLRSRGTEANQSLVLIDGVEANDLALGGGFDFAHLTSVGIERVEVLRGPQSALWGSEALGGVISLRTPRGRGAPSASLSAEGGAFGTGALRGSIGLGGERADGFLAVGRRAVDGTNVSRSGEEDDGYENTTLATRLGWQPTQTLRVDVTGRYVDATTEFDPIGIDARPMDGDRETDTEQLLLGARLGWQGRDDRLRSHIAVDLTDTDNVTRADGVETNQAAGEKLKLTWQGSVDFTTRLPRRAQHRVTLAAERERDEFHQRADSPFGDPNQDRETVSHSAILEYRGRVQALTVSASVRHDANEDFEGATTWRTGVVWNPAGASTRLHASAGEAVKNPTFTERFGFFPDQFQGNPDLEPERSLGWEVGVEQRLANERVSLAATWFSSELEDEIDGFVFDPASGAFTAENVDGESERSGVEMRLRARPTQRATLFASATWLDATEPDAVGRSEEIRRPEWSATVRGSLAFAEDRGDLWIGASWSGERTDQDFATVPATRVELGSRARLNAAVSYRVLPRLELWLRGDNLTGADNEEVLGFATPGAAAYAGLRLTLGDPL